jgi:hypothetical protein
MEVWAGMGSGGMRVRVIDSVSYLRLRESVNADSESFSWHFAIDVLAGEFLD